ncbi:MAG: CcdB family protein [Burkholderiaceae bacterium]|jgi:toxin CcdB|nr:CcdB family protein [Burkholderiaceae bacterium]
MARFDIYANTGKNKINVPFLVDVQSDYLGGLSTRVVVPMIRVDAFAPAKLPADLTPVFQIENIECMFYPAFMSAVPMNELGNSIGSLKAAQDKIMTARDRLTGGF